LPFLLLCNALASCRGCRLLQLCWLLRVQHLLVSYLHQLVPFAVMLLLLLHTGLTWWLHWLSIISLQHHLLSIIFLLLITGLLLLAG
jgi:hypothetical protein